MKFLKSIIYVTVASIFLVTNVQCGSSKHQLQESQTDIKPSNAYYQEWFSGIKVGGSGINIYLANLNSQNKVTIDSVFFRRMKGKLIQGRAQYTAILKKPSRHYENISSVFQEGKKKLNVAANFPFELTYNECIVSYIENGETKYFKVKNLTERKGVYYEQGPPVVLNN